MLIIFSIISLLVAETSSASEIVHTVVTCTDPLQLHCPTGKKIAVVRANFGRFSVSVCNPMGLTDISTNCTSFTTLSTINNMCGGLQNCSVRPSISLFGDSCPGTPKYLEVQFSCPEADLADRRLEPSFQNQNIRDVWEPREKFLSEEIVRSSLSQLIHDEQSIPNIKTTSQPTTAFTITSMNTAISDVTEVAILHTKHVNEYSTEDAPVPEYSTEDVTAPEYSSDEATTNSTNETVLVVDASEIGSNHPGNQDESIRKRIVLIVIVSSSLLICIIILVFCCIKKIPDKKISLFNDHNLENGTNSTSSSNLSLRSQPNSTNLSCSTPNSAQLSCSTPLNVHIAGTVPASGQLLCRTQNTTPVSHSTSDTCFTPNSTPMSCSRGKINSLSDHPSNCNPILCSTPRSTSPNCSTPKVDIQSGCCTDMQDDRQLHQVHCRPVHAARLRAGTTVYCAGASVYNVPRQTVHEINPNHLCQHLPTYFTDIREIPVQLDSTSSILSVHTLGCASVNIDSCTTEQPQNMYKSPRPVSWRSTNYLESSCSS